MKKQMRKFLIATLIALTSLVAVVPTTYATGDTNFSVLLTASNVNVVAGETVDVTLELDNFENIGEGINSFMGDLEYDNTKLSLEDSQIKSQNGWDAPSYNNENGKILTAKDTMITEKEAIIKMTFKVKEDAELGKTTIKVKNAEASNSESDFIGTDGEIEIEIKERTVEPEGGEPTVSEKTLSDLKIAKAPTKTEYTEGEKFDKTGMVVIAEYSDGTTKEVTEYTYSPDGKLEESNTKITVTYTEGELTKTVEQDITVKKAPEGDKGNTEEPKKELPQAGIENNILVMIIAVGIVLVISYFGYTKYKKIH